MISKKSLFKIHGLGPNNLERLLFQLGLPSHLHHLTDFQYSLLLSKLAPLNLSSSLQNNIVSIKRHILNHTYKGTRFTKGLPVRGQRTRTNAKTARTYDFSKKT